MKRRRLLVSFVIVLAFIVSCQKKEKTYLLRLSYSKGDVFEILYHNFAAPNGDSNKGSALNSQIKMRFKVDSLISDTAYIFSGKIIHMYLNSSIGSDEQYYYSKNKLNKGMSKEEKQLHSDLDRLIDSTFFITVSNRGEILSPFKFKSGAPAGIIIDYENCQLLFPRDSITIEEKWTNERTAKFINSKRKSTFYIKRIENSNFIIDVEGYVDIFSNSKIKKKFSGTYVIDSATKKLKSVRIDTEIDIAFKGEGTNTLAVQSRNIFDD